MLDLLKSDLRHGARVLRHAPGLSAVVVATLALALGGATTAFGVLDAVVLRPLALPDARQVVLLDHRYGSEPGAFSPPTFVELRRETTAFSALAASVPW